MQDMLDKHVSIEYSIHNINGVKMVEWVSFLIQVLYSPCYMLSI